MNVGELIKQLEKYDPKTHVVVTTESESIIKKEDLFRVFEIIDTHKTKAELTRLDDGRPSLKYNRSKNSVDLIEIEIAEE
ncbi:hypothetical protein DYD21_08945 [Rhodohalobacter sp. SW132]|uniref:hypothetical protein n=1 Tax=Rhodohalobacter sp. SW132 TaxID=2293433 RepID=UPI000E2757C7|nr:hypothetical protein [Rhodohalobacter sp. SW132]REL37896.1 hypothetical protein DYD21_08945 [Rhodohalobacter sp. SW132]